jgi:hypothetical protein
MPASDPAREVHLGIKKVRVYGQEGSPLQNVLEIES